MTYLLTDLFSNIERKKLDKALQIAFNKRSLQKIVKERKIQANKMTDIEIWRIIAASTLKTNQLSLEEKFRILISIVPDRNIISTSVIYSYAKRYISYDDYEFLIYNLFQLASTLSH